MMLTDPSASQPSNAHSIPSRLRRAMIIVCKLRSVLFLCSLAYNEFIHPAIQVNWRFTTEDARIKLKHLYPSIEE
jgi:hypothetical protein